MLKNETPLVYALLWNQCEGFQHRLVLKYYQQGDKFNPSNYIDENLKPDAAQAGKRNSSSWSLLTVNSHFGFIDKNTLEIKENEPYLLSLVEPTPGRHSVHFVNSPYTVIGKILHYLNICYSDAFYNKLIIKKKNLIIMIKV